MNQTKLIPFLDTMGSALIDGMNINLKQDTITLWLKPDTRGPSSPVEITFEEVSAFYYLDEHRQAPPLLAPPKDQLSAISFYSEGFGQFAAIEVVDGVESPPFVVSYPNFIISMMDRSLLIEARTVKINGQTYRVGYPKN